MRTGYTAVVPGPLACAAAAIEWVLDYGCEEGLEKAPRETEQLSILI